MLWRGAASRRPDRPTAKKQRRLSFFFGFLFYSVSFRFGLVCVTSMGDGRGFGGLPRVMIQHGEGGRLVLVD